MANWVMFLLVGLAAGWLSTQIMRHRELDLFGSLCLGVLGALLGGFVFRLLGIATTNWLGALLCATLGAMALIWIVRYFNGRK